MANKVKPLTAARLHELLVYNPETGNFINRIDRFKTKAGEIPGCLSPEGYWQISLDGRTYTAQSLAYLYMKGEWCSVQMDHINTYRTDNRWINLRPATSQQNAIHGHPYRNNTSGFRGVSWSSSNNKWQARVMVNGKRKTVGYFSDILKAAKARVKAANEIYGEFADPFSLLEIMV